MTDTVALADQFHKAMLETCAQAIRHCNYNPSYFRRMVLEHGGVQTAKQLIHTEQPSEGLTRLWECGRLDLSMEDHMLKPEFQSLFSDDELLVAKNRLADLGYTCSGNGSDRIQLGD